MPRIPRAAKQLHTEIASVINDATIVPSEPDGFGVYRTIVFEGDGVDRILTAISHDKRIKAVSGNVVEFVSGTRADSSDSFNAAKAHDVFAHGELIPGTGIPAEDPEPTLEERLQSMTKAEIAEEYGYDKSASKKDMVAEILNDEPEASED
jgi:hypothetical protein